MKQHRARIMSSAFDDAFDLLKMEHFNALYGADLFDSILFKAQTDGILRKKLSDYTGMTIGQLVNLPPEEKMRAFRMLQEHIQNQPKDMDEPKGEMDLEDDAVEVGDRPEEPEMVTPKREAFSKAVEAYMSSYFGY